MWGAAAASNADQRYSDMAFQTIAKKKVKHLVHGKPLHFVTPDHTVKEAANMMKDNNIGALAVMEGARLVGIVSERDVVHRCVGIIGCDPVKRRVADIMTFPPMTIEKNMSLSTAAVMMIENNIRHLPVVAGARVLGMISIRQVVQEFKLGLEASIAGAIFELA